MVSETRPASDMPANDSSDGEEGLTMAIMQDVAVSVLGFRENDEWCALALEMDLRGYGKTFDEAVEDLYDCIKMQIGFARFKNQPDMVFHPAEPIYFSLFAQIRNDHLASIAAGRASGANLDEVEDEYAVAGIPLPPAHVIAPLTDKFALADGLERIRIENSSRSSVLATPSSRSTRIGARGASE